MVVARGEGSKHEHKARCARCGITAAFAPDAPNRRTEIAPGLIFLLVESTAMPFSSLTDWGAILLTATLSFQNALAEPLSAYPGRPVRIVAGIAPGGGTDIVARAVAQKLSDRWGRPVVIENRTGAGGAFAMDLVARATPDGHTLLIAPLDIVATATLLKKVVYDTRKAYSPIVQMTIQPYLLVVIPGLPVNSVKELIDYARSNPEALTYASSGKGTASHVGMEMLKSMAHINIRHIPYSGVSVGMIDMLGGRVQTMLGSAISAGPNVKAGKLKALAVTGPHRSQAYPDLPTVSESGVPGFDVSGSHSLFAPSGTAPGIVLAVNKEVNQIVQQPEIKTRLAVLGAETVPPNTPAQFNQVLETEVAKWAKFFKERPDVMSD